MITLLLFFPYCRDKAALLTSKENHRWTMPTSRDRTRAWASTKAYCKAQCCISNIFCPVISFHRIWLFLILTLLLQAIGWINPFIYSYHVTQAGRNRVKHWRLVHVLLEHRCYKIEKLTHFLYCSRWRRNV